MPMCAIRGSQNTAFFQKARYSRGAVSLNRIFENPSYNIGTVILNLKSWSISDKPRIRNPVFADSILLRMPQAVFSESDLASSCANPAISVRTNFPLESNVQIFSFSKKPPDIDAFEPADCFNCIHSVPCESRKGLCNNHVNFPLFAITDHLLKGFPMSA